MRVASRDKEEVQCGYCGANRRNRCTCPVRPEARKWFSNTGRSLVAGTKPELTVSVRFLHPLVRQIGQFDHPAADWNPEAPAAVYAGA